MIYVLKTMLRVTYIYTFKHILQLMNFDFNRDESEKPDARFKLDFFLVFIGYTLILFIEKVVFKMRDHSQLHSHDGKVQESNEDVIKEQHETNQKMAQIDANLFWFNWKKAIEVYKIYIFK